MTDRYDYLIIGGGIAGVTAAETIRENDVHGTIVIIGEEEHILYSRVLLPAYLKGKIERSKLFLRKAEDFTDKRIDLRLGEKVLYVDVKRKEIGFASRSNVGYEKLLIASGGSVKPWGGEEVNDFIFRLQTLNDADRLSQALSHIKRPLVIGASFIGLELLGIFVENGITPNLLARGSHFMDKILDEEGGEMLHDNFLRYGINFQFGDTAKEVVKKGGGLLVTTEGLRRVECDSVALGIGIERNISFLAGSGITLGERGVLTNEFLETNEPGVFAAGDAAEFYDVIFNKHRVMGNWTSAFLQGKRAGLNMVDKKELFRNVSAYSITSLGFQITAVGESVDFSDSIVRTDRAKNKYERFFLKDNVMVGAALINQFSDKARLAQLIETKTPLGEYRGRLSDWGFDIHEIPVVGLPK